MNLTHEPKPMSNGHALACAEHHDRGDDVFELRFVLMDCEKGEQLKAKMMTRVEAWKKNQNLRGTGFAWAMCSR